MDPDSMNRLSAVAEARERNLARRHHEWRQKPQDILVVFTGVAVREVLSAAKRLAKNTGRFDIDLIGKPERRQELPPGHPPMLGIEHVDPVIMTVMLHCSMAQVVELITYDLPKGMAVVPIPSERANTR